MVANFCRTVVRKYVRAKVYLDVFGLNYYVFVGLFYFVLQAISLKSVSKQRIAISAFPIRIPSEFLSLKKLTVHRVRLISCTSKKLAGLFLLNDNRF